MTAKVEICHGWKKGEVPVFDEITVSDGSIHAALLSEADKSDPHNRRIVAFVRVGDRFCVRVNADMPDRYDRGKEVLSLLIAALVEHHAEIRDAIAAEREAAG